MLNNLIDAMNKKKITRTQIAAAIDLKRPASVSDKLNGKYPFTFDEAVKIKKTFFPEYEIEFLFSEKEEYKEAI